MNQTPTMTPEQFAEGFGARLLEAAQRAAERVGGEPVLLQLAGVLCNFGAARGMSPGDLAATLRHFADLVEENAAEISATKTSH
jgi:hypothetical protein